MHVSLLKKFASPLIALATVAIGGAAQAATFSIEANSQGWFEQNGFNSIETPDQIENTFTGTLGGIEFRSFFTFDVSNLKTPIQGATLRLFQEAYFSGDSTESVVAYDVSTSPDVLNSALSLAEGQGVFNDLGSGSVYGGGTASAEDFGNPQSGFFEITLSGAAIDAINAAQQGTGYFSLGLVLASLGGTEREGAEGLRFSDPEAGTGGPASLVVYEAPQAVPEPVTLLGLSTVAIGAAFLKRPNKPQA